MWRRPDSRTATPFGGNDCEQGFSLVEALCAMVIAASALVVLLRGLGSTQLAASHLEAHLGARLIAMSILEDERQAEPMAAGRRAGDSGMYRWAVTVEPTASPLAERLPRGLRLYRATAEVSWQPGGSLVLDTLVLGK
jgi:type II secretory pathway component PulJ